MSFLAPLKVLVIEDDENDTILINRALERLGCARGFTRLPDSEDVIPYLRGENQYANRQVYPFPNVLLMDNRMPLLAGLDVLFWLRTEPYFARLPVVILTGTLMPSELAITQRLKAIPVLKSMGFESMPQALEQGIRAAFEMVGQVQNDPRNGLRAA